MPIEQASLDALGHLAYVALIVGHLVVARGKRRALGFWLRFVGSLGWAALGWALGLSSVLLWSLGFAAADAYGAVRASRG